MTLKVTDNQYGRLQRQLGFLMGQPLNCKLKGLATC